MKSAIAQIIVRFAAGGGHESVIGGVGSGFSWWEARELVAEQG